MSSVRKFGMHLTAFATCVALFGSPVRSEAQGSRVLITVLQPGSTGPIGAAGAVVCFSSIDYSKLTGPYGGVTFENVPAGQWSAVAWTSGFRAKRADISVPGTATDVRATITLSELSSEASPCILPSTPPPTSSFPPHEAGKVTLVVTVYRGSDVTPLKDAYVCVGSDGSHRDSYAKRAYTDATGRVVFHVDHAPSWYVTAGKGGFASATSQYFLASTAEYGIVQFRLFAGSPGYICPLPTITAPIRR